MSYTLDYGFTPATTTVEHKLPVDVFKWSNDFNTKSATTSETILVNLTSPIDRTESIRVAASEVKNIYNGLGIDSDFYLPSTKGVSILSQLRQTWKYSDPANPANPVYYLPFTAQLTLRVPQSEFVSADDVLKGIERLIGSLFDTESTSTSRLASLLRECVKPSDM